MKEGLDTKNNDSRNGIFSEELERDGITQKAEWKDRDRKHERKEEEIRDSLLGRKFKI